MTTKNKNVSPVELFNGGLTLKDGNIILLDIDGNPNGIATYYEISSGTTHTARLYMALEDSYFIYRGRRHYIKSFIFPAERRRQEQQPESCS